MPDDPDLMPGESTSRLLFTVEDVFSIRSRGLILVPGITPRSGESVRVGDRVVLHRPDGSRVEVVIGGLEAFHSPPPIRPEVPAMIRGLSRDDVPIGTQVWSIGS